MKISIICPIYNGEDYIEALNESLMLQQNVELFEVRYILTKSKDNSEEILKRISAKYKRIEPDNFSHSLTREKEAYEAEGDIIVFITQDIKIKDTMWLYNLTKDIELGLCDASYSRQICENKTIERYTRMKNYSEKSRIVSKADLDTLGIMTYFYSDAASAIRKSVFTKLKGYDGKILLTNEDMYIAYKIINNGYKIKYCSDSVVIHSHEYTYKALFKRYFDQGVFLKQHEYITNSGANEGAISLLKFVVINSLKEKNFRAFFDIVPNFGVRFIANKFGSNYKKISREKILKYTSSPNYWSKEEV
ncbi:glycosyltransferase [Clostridium sp. SHJSY1]|uniref:glycosyltransferase family 2 protein n=1 Tax=Clostridium sp. SHJSY1 TaxID=2942483 RepID=UPI002876E769|nr:glycosyltransferase [Clostridium sp. SHJSY1]MDS0525590.1 glycosyltransferase [Clostridium sp. SHJSY1]